MAGNDDNMQKINCQHCAGTGKCNCYDCSLVGDPKYYHSDIEKSCIKCHGFGFIFIKNDGTVVAPKTEEEEDEEDTV